jgi:V/A-type H+-transporting ATPase subunit C
MSDRKVTDKDYLYLSSLLRTREAQMLTRDIAERMIDAPGFDEAAKLLSECGYPAMAGNTAAGVEERLSERRGQLYGELIAIVPQTELMDIFRARFDYHNAKVLIKAEGAGVDGGFLLSGTGRFEPERLTEAYRSEEFRDYPEVFAGAVLEAKSVLARTENPQLSDFILDKAYFTELSMLAAAVASPNVSRYIEALADSVNLNAAVRTLRIGRDADFLKNALVPGGSREADAVIQAAFTADGLEALFKGSTFEAAGAEGAKAAYGGSLTQFEKECDNAVSRSLSDIKFVSFGPEVVVAFLAALESEITSARMILTGKLTGVKPEKLRGRLRG